MVQIQVSLFNTSVLLSMSIMKFVTWS